MSSRDNDDAGAPDEPMQAISMGSVTGVVDADECVLIGTPPTIEYAGRGRSRLDVSWVALTYAHLRELIDQAEAANKPLLFVGNVIIQPAVFTQDTFTPVDKAVEEEALRAANG